MNFGNIPILTWNFVSFYSYKSMLEKTEGEIKNGHSRDSGNNGNKTLSEDKQNKTYNTKTK